ncbi:hypothetical protein EIN_033770 [Entamoeba invadens IP1]|uniref:Uncharacterized protein n=1 Tax=Entamoeba invadens IP1 TaxID=370355 RepID=A0A0A1U470_ENTIV|nr:hypothetical protein EIN_033770 [Entamoeba invadens IP1]ELP86486.1 hypothetical protein EIN_033770 [Entamoeba invadens IP1]|eukprot:XP_004185832.1 hypothetical protein EIN_033770 [Entamoeba invadens IP1]
MSGYRGPPNYPPPQPRSPQDFQRPEYPPRLPQEYRQQQPDYNQQRNQQYQIPPVPQYGQDQRQQYQQPPYPPYQQQDRVHLQRLPPQQQQAQRDQQMYQREQMQYQQQYQRSASPQYQREQQYTREQDGPQQPKEDFRVKLADNKETVELKTNVLVITNFQEKQMRDFMGTRTAFEAYLPVYKIEIVSVADRKAAEGLMSRFKTSPENKENKEVHWGMEYWMKHAVFDSDKGVCRISVRHIPPTVVVNQDGTYEYIMGNRKGDRRNEYYIKR